MQSFPQKLFRCPPCIGLQERLSQADSRPYAVRIPYRLSRWPLWLFLFSTLVFTGCGRTLNRAAERRIRDALPNLLGEAKQYRVHVDSAPLQTIQGQLADVTIDGEDVQLANGLLLDRMHLALRGVDVDTGRKRVRHVCAATFTATVSQASLNVYLAGASPEDERIRNARLTLGPRNLVTLAAERLVLGAGIPFTVTGPVRLAGPERIELDPRHLDVIGIGIAGKPLQFLKSRFETAIDLSSLAFPVQFTSVSVTPGLMTLAGTADVETLLRRTPGP